MKKTKHWFKYITLYNLFPLFGGRKMFWAVLIFLTNTFGTFNEKYADWSLLFYGVVVVGLAGKDIVNRVKKEEHNEENS